MLHMIVSHLREAICMRDWRVGCLRTVWFCSVTMRILTRLAWQLHSQMFHLVPRMITFFFILRFVFKSSAHLECLFQGEKFGEVQIPCNITLVRTIALVSCLARLHNFCIDEVKRTKEHNKDPLPTDIEHMMNGPEGYAPMVKDYSHDVPTLKDKLDGGNHFDDCPWAARQSRRADIVANNKLPCTVLLNHVIGSHKTRPHANM